jgi:ABC-type microcin C transport system duplicated ATPase subunit YejF
VPTEFSSKFSSGPSSSSPLLAIDQLTIAFRGKPVVRELSLTIEPGRVLGLVGESGSGKSVTSLAILGLQDSAAEVRGSIRFDGEELLTLQPEAMRRYRPAYRHDLSGADDGAEPGDAGGAADCGGD